MPLQAATLFTTNTQFQMHAGEIQINQAVRIEVAKVLAYIIKLFLHTSQLKGASNSGS